MSRANEPAFPTPVPEGFGYTVGGLSKREYFASMAMQGLLSANPKLDTDDGHRALELIVKAAVMLSNALIAELEHKEPT